MTTPSAPLTPTRVTTVNVDEIYDQKENIQPLSTGRSAKKLHNIFTLDRKSLEEELREGHERFKTELDSADELDDPLDVYHRYIQWTLQSYPSGSSHLVPLLERTTVEFVPDQRYKNDLRYLRIWLLYSKHVEAPKDIFKFLEENQIGLVHTSFYHEWALLEQQARNFKEADRIYKLGIHRQAQPSKPLKTYYDNFQAQMLLPQSQSQDRITDSQNESSARNVRAILGTSSSSNTNNNNGGGFLQPLGDLSTKKKNNNNSARGFAVLNDAEGAIDSSSSKQSSKWEDIGTIASRKAENEKGSVPWKGEKLPMSNNSAKNSERIQVFRDDEEQPWSQPLSSKTLQSSQPESQSQPALTKKSTAPSSSSSSSIQRRPGEPRLVASFDDICSLYEIIAKRKGLYPNNHHHTDQEKDNNFVLGEWFNVDTDGRPIRIDTDTIVQISDEKKTAGGGAKRRKSSVAGSRRKSSMSRSKRESLTINTKEALAEVHDMFASTMKFDKDGLSPSSSSSNDGFEEGDEDEEEGEIYEDDEEAVDDTFWGVPSVTTAKQAPDDSVKNKKTDREDDVQFAIGATLQSKIEEQQQDRNVDFSNHEEIQEENNPIPLSTHKTPNPNHSINNQENENDGKPVNNRITGREGRLPGGRFANMIHTMTPITERTGDLTTMTSFAYSSRKSSEIHEDDELDEVEEEVIVEDATNAIEDRSRDEAHKSVTSDDTFQTAPNATATTSAPVGFSLFNDSEQHYDNTMQDHSPKEQIIQQKQKQTGPPPCDPFETALINRFLLESSDTLQSLEIFHDTRDQSLGQAVALSKSVKKKKSRKTSNGGGAGAGAATSRKDSSDYILLDLKNADARFEIINLLGEGGYASVYKATEISNLIDDSDDDDDQVITYCAIKTESPCNVWEFCILNDLRHRVSDRTLASIISPKGQYAFADESYLVMEYCDMGTLLDSVNKSTTNGFAPNGARGMDETLAIFFMIELLRTVEAFHNADIIHADLKADNCMLRLENIPCGDKKAWSSAYRRDGSDGWSYKGIKIIDFGRSIDIGRFPSKQQQKFISNLHSNSGYHDCYEIREGLSWSYESDYYGLASIAHVLLFGEFMAPSSPKTTSDSTNDNNNSNNTRGSGEKQRISQTFRRYHQTHIWIPLFDMLLNPRRVRSDASLPITREISAIRSKMEDWLELNTEKDTKNLKALLRKVEIAAV